MAEHIWKNCDALSERRNLIQRFVDIFRRVGSVKTAEIVDRDMENRYNSVKACAFFNEKRVDDDVQQACAIRR